MELDEKLFDYVKTDMEREALEAIRKHGECQKADAACGRARSWSSGKLNQVRKRAAMQGYAPNHFTNGVAPGFTMGKVTIQRGPDGIERVWERQSPESAAALEAFEETIQSMCEGIKGKSRKIKPPKTADKDLLTVIPMGDPHFGMLSWQPETGEDFNLEKAEAVTFAAVDALTDLAPKSGTGLLLNLGDYFHADDGTNRTRNSGAQLDVDGRFQKVAQVGFRAMIRCVERMLEKNEKVIVRNNKGNHDPHQSLMLNIAVNAWFHNEPRVYVDPSPSPFWYYRFGSTLIGSTHGDGAKLPDLPLIMANDAPEDWAKAEHRVWHVGHFHHNQKFAQKDLVGCEVETHRTLAASDAWHHHSGYRSKKDMKAIVYHRSMGEVNRIRWGIERFG